MYELGRKIYKKYEAMTRLKDNAESALDAPPQKTKKFNKGGLMGATTLRAPTTNTRPPQAQPSSATMNDKAGHMAYEFLNRARLGLSKEDKKGGINT
tara:strand:- start:2811 stop:3101 length:291 start_codon:yes stop_codon:yes gene_type:complete